MKTDTARMLADNRGRDGMGAATNQGIAEMTGKPAEAGGPRRVSHTGFMWSAVSVDTSSSEQPLGV